MNGADLPAVLISPRTRTGTCIEQGMGGRRGFGLTWRFSSGLAKPPDHMLCLLEQVAAVGLRVDQAQLVKHLPPIVGTC